MPCGKKKNVSWKQVSPNLSHSNFIYIHRHMYKYTVDDTSRRRTKAKSHKVFRVRERRPSWGM